MAIRSVPQPPFSEELLADLHAGNVAPELDSRLRAVVHDDPEAVEYLRSLDEVSCRVRALGTDELMLHPMPTDIADRMARFLEELESSGNGAARAESFAPDSDVDRPAATNGSGSVVPIDLRERRRARLRWSAAAAAAVAVIAGVGLVTQLPRGDDQSPTAQPTTDEDRIGDDLTTTAALAALGRNEVSGPLGERNALLACVHAAGLERAVLGSTDMRYEGRNAVLILLAGPKPPKVTALVVGPGCANGDPQVKNITDIG
ncbi:hypothetical protein ACTD5D_02675 [Nocardia takedensis]|uniref:hypothetical protein n=1 Tax=Nocardia takedensis TaxID=259390 RepID=UPI0005928D0A|nr:hypothetical protein [Nocardia takedensis]